MIHADPIASQIAINQCEAELSALGERRRLSMRVRDILTNSEQHYLSIEHVADQLHMSDRTLKRQLAAEGTSFLPWLMKSVTGMPPRCCHVPITPWNRLPMNWVIAMSPILAAPLSAGVAAVQATGVKIRIYKTFVFCKSMYKHAKNDLNS